MKSVMNLPNPPQYEVFDHESVKELSCIKIVEGDFDGVTFHFDIVKLMPEELENGTIPLRYTYTMMEGVILEDEKEQFEEIVTSILFSLVEENENV